MLSTLTFALLERAQSGG